MKLTNTEVRVETTNKCQARCEMCSHDTMTRGKHVMSENHFRYLVHQAKELGATLISPFGFGEPLMDPTIVEKIRFCTILGLDTFLTTNAGFLTTNMAYGLLDAGLKRLRISAHGLWDDYNGIHKGLNFKTFTRNVFNFIKTNDVKFDKACEVDVTIIPQDGANLDEFVKFWRGKVDNIEIWKPHNWGGTKDYRKPTTKKLKTCGRPFIGPVQIQANGTVIPCCFLTDSEIVLGDTHVETIEEILKGERFNELRRKHGERDLSGLACETCDQLYVGESPLLYSTVEAGVNKTSSQKFNLLEN
jgi:radical SAM protein with 4Fe4S-binding SPASM domain